MVGAADAAWLPSNDEMLDGLFVRVRDQCLRWLARDEFGNMLVSDPLEGKPIFAHYATSHCAAALLLAHSPGSDNFDTGLALLRGLIQRWSVDSALPDFHADFNSMALCMAEERLSKLGIEGELCADARKLVLGTKDSAHDTINWLPMRMFVNSRRYSWTGNKRWRRAEEVCRAKIARATHHDGFIEDRLPLGTSFNLQYNVSTVALLKLLNARGADFDIDSSLTALANATSPDGDINYLGRGCNQVFCWGPWLYLLKATGQSAAFAQGASFLERFLPGMLSGANIMLSDLEGPSRDMWWDYHYCSVYISHLLLWLSLARGTPAPREGLSGGLSPIYGGDSGVTIIRSSDHFAVLTSGKREYLAERGPALAALWTKSAGMVHKGELGPWLKSFGFRYSSPNVLLNHFGLLELNARHSRFSCRPLFPVVELGIDSASLIVRFESRRARFGVMNIPMLPGARLDSLLVRANDASVGVRETGTITTMYGIKHLIQSFPARAKTWEIRVPL